MPPVLTLLRREFLLKGHYVSKSTLENYSIGVYSCRMITVAETAPFQRKIGTLLSDEERTDLVAYLAEYLGAGVLMQ